MAHPPRSEVNTERTDLVRTALVLEWLTLGWVLIEAAVAIWAGSQARSLSLIAFGADSLIEALSACVLLWRLNVELWHGHAFSEDVERKASKIGGVLLFALAAYVVASAAWGLWTREGQEFSRLGLVITAATIPIMYLLAKRKLAVAEKIGSRALRTDAMESITCGWLGLGHPTGLGRVVGRFYYLTGHRLLPGEGRARGLGRRGMRLLFPPLSSEEHSMPQDHWLPGFNFNVEEWFEGDTTKRSPSAARPPWPVPHSSAAVAEKPAA